MSSPTGTAAGKAARRRKLIAARRAVPDDERRADAVALAAGLPDLVAEVADPICLYVAIGSEPGVASDGARPLLDAALTLGRRVLVPVVVDPAPLGRGAGDRGPLDWAEYTGPEALVDAAHGLREPRGARLGPKAVGRVGLVLVPALAVDRRGVRLGRGAGHYDRTLPLVGPSTRIVALVRDPELVDELPAEDHDVRVHAVWRPRHGVTTLPAPVSG